MKLVGVHYDSEIIQGTDPPRALERDFNGLPICSRVEKCLLLLMNGCVCVCVGVYVVRGRVGELGETKIKRNIGQKVDFNLESLF